MFFAKTIRGQFARMFILAVLTATSLHAQTAEDAIRYTQRLPATNAWSSGMAGAGLAGFGNSSALILNPAGMGWMASSQFGATLNFYRGENEAVYSPGENSVTEDLNRTGLSSVSYMYRAPTGRGSLVVGVGLNQTANFNNSFSFSGDNPNNSVTDYFLPGNGDYSVDIGDDGVIGTDDDLFEFSSPISAIAFETFAIDFDPTAYAAGSYPFLPAVTAGTVGQDGSLDESGEMYELNAGIAWEAARNVMVGVGANLVFGDYELRRNFVELDLDDANNGSGETTDFDNLEIDEYLSSGMYGVNLRAGVSAGLSPFLRLGATIESPTRYEISEDYGTTIYTEFDNGDLFEYGGLNGDIGSGSFDYRIVTPWRFGGGAMLKFGSLRLFADAELIDWSQMELRADLDQAYFDELNESISESYESVVNTRFGLEYMLNRLGIRIGWGTTKDGRIDPVVNRDKEYGSFGLGYRFRNGFQLNLGWLTEMYDDQYLPYTDLSTFSPVQFDDDPVVSRSVVRSFFKLDIGFKL